MKVFAPFSPTIAFTSAFVIVLIGRRSAIAPHRDLSHRGDPHGTKWPARTDDALSGQELSDEIHFAAHIAGRVMTALFPSTSRSSRSEKNRGTRPTERMMPSRIRT